MDEKLIDAVGEQHGRSKGQNIVSHSEMILCTLESYASLLHLNYSIYNNYTYPDAGYPDRQLSGSAWPFG
jgi:hypothetical protein